MLDTTSTGKTRFMEPTLTRASERSRARGKREGRAAPASSRAAARLGERRPSQRPLKAPLRRDRGRLGRLVLVAAVLDLARRPSARSTCHCIAYQPESSSSAKSSRYRSGPFAPARSIVCSQSKMPAVMLSYGCQTEHSL